MPMSISAVSGQSAGTTRSRLEPGSVSVSAWAAVSTAARARSSSASTPASSMRPMSISRFGMAATGSRACQASSSSLSR